MTATIELEQGGESERAPLMLAPGSAVACEEPVPSDCYRAAFDLAAEALCVLDDDRYCLRANAAAQRLFGVERLGGHRIDEFVPARVRELLVRRWAAFLVDGLASGETEIVRPDGSTVEVRFSGVARVAPGLNVGVLEATGDPREGAGVAFGPLRRAPRGGNRATLDGVRVLLVGGDRNAGAAIALSLSELGVVVHAARDGDAALAELAAPEGLALVYDLALIDYAMAGAREWVVRAIGSKSPRSRPAIVMITSPAERQDAAAIGELDGFVSKPVDIARLTDELARVVSLRREGSPGPATSASPAAATKPYAGRVLVAEDNRVSLSIAVKLLTARGFDVEVAGDGQAALELHARDPYDVIFVGCSLPVLDGLSATREIRRRESESGRHTPIVAMTPKRLRGDTERCLAAGVDYCAGRPISPAGLDYVLSRAFRVRPGAAAAASGPGVALG